MKRVSTLVVKLADCDFLIGGTGICAVRRSRQEVAKDYVNLVKSVAKLQIAYKKVYFFVEADRKQEY
jgi:hypothetical protein